MSKKRTAAESSNNAEEEETLNNGAATDVPQEDNAKHAKLTAFSDTTLQDLPFELIECILIKVVAMEVKSMKLAKSVWKEKADPVISRLAAVCSQWSSVLSTDVFRNRLDRALEGMQGAIRFEILHQYMIPFRVSSVTTLGDEMFLLCSQQLHTNDHRIKVYDCYNVEEVKYDIPLPAGSSPERIVACTVSNCVYILTRKLYDHFSILRITAGDSDPRWSTVSEVIGEVNLPKCKFCLTDNGGLVLSRSQTKRHPAISVFDANGSLQQKIWLSPDIADFSDLIPTPNGNLVLRASRAHVYNDDDNDDDDDGGGDDDYHDDDGDDGDNDYDDDGDNDYDDGDDYYDGDYYMRMQVKLTEIDLTAWEKDTPISAWRQPAGRSAPTLTYCRQ